MVASDWAYFTVRAGEWGINWFWVWYSSATSIWLIWVRVHNSIYIPSLAFFAVHVALGIVPHSTI